MRAIAQTASLIALAATLGPALLYFAGLLTHGAVEWATLFGTLLWFIATPLWMGR